MYAETSEGLNIYDNCAPEWDLERVHCTRT